MYWCNYHTRMYLHKTEEQRKKQQKEIHCSLVGRLFRKNSTPTANVFTANGPTSLLSITVYSSPQHPTWQRAREAQTNSERKSLLAANPRLAGFSRTAVSNKESCLRKKKRGGKKNAEYFTTIQHEERGCGGQGGMNDGEILLKSSNDRGQFLLTRRKRYNESTDWWILRFKSWLIGSKRILRSLLRSVAQQQVSSSVGKCRILEVKPKEQFSSILSTSGRHSTQSHMKACWWAKLKKKCSFLSLWI